MFERYTEKARRVIFFGRYEASQFGSPYIETEHLLLGLLREDKPLTNRLLRSEAVVQDIRNEIERCTDVREKTSTSADLPLSNEAKRVLLHAAEEADRLGHKQIGTEHLLFGMLREEKSFAAKLLNDRNVRLSQVREQLQQSEPEPAARVPGGGQLSVHLSDFGSSLTDQARDGMLPPLVGREQELQRVVQVLCRLTRGNPVLLGEPGVGKKTIVFGLAKQIAEGAIPELDGRSIVSLDPAVIASGTKSRARFEDNLEGILREPSDQPAFLLFIDGLHALAQTQPFSVVANVIKPALLDGRLQCISTATAAEYSKTVETAPWLEQCFTTVEVKPPTEAEAIAVLIGIKDRFQAFHEVTYTEEAIQYAVFHSSSYFPNRSLPEKAIDLIDEAGARVKLRQSGLPDEIAELQKRIKLIVHRLQSAIVIHEFEKARFYSDEERKARENLRALREKHQLTDAIATVTRDDIEQIVAEKTGLSVDLLRKSKAEKPKDEKK